MGDHEGEEVTMDDLVKTDGLYYEKFSHVPFTGKITGNERGSFMYGVKHGLWVSFHENGRLSQKGTYKNGEKQGYWVWYHADGTVDANLTGTFKNGVKVD